MRFMFLAIAAWMSLAHAAVIRTRNATDDNGTCAANSFQVKDTAQNNTVFPYRSYVSSPLKPPNMAINTTGEPLQPGLLFFTNVDAGYNFSAQQGLLIMTDEGDLVFGVATEAANFQPQTLNGHPVFSYWEGIGSADSNGRASSGYGKVEIFDDKYNGLYTVCPNLTITLKPGAETPPCLADVHESFITEDGTMMVTVYNLTQTDLSSVGGPSDGWVEDPLAVEIDPATNEILFLWSALEHVPITESQLPLSGDGYNASAPYDYFHMNSIQKYRGGYLINSRHTWATYYADKNGTIQWSVNGKDGGDLGGLPSGVNFSWQHDARIWDDPNDSDRAILSWFANNNQSPNETNPSIGLSIDFDYPPSPSSNATLLRDLSNSGHEIFVYSQGANNFLPNGNSFVGYGAIPYMEEYSPKGELLWSARFSFDRQLNTSSSYRAFKSDWHATPNATIPSLIFQAADATDPLAQCAGSSKLRGYVSWNGATDINAWNVYLGNSTDQMEMQYSVPKKGFETVFAISDAAKYAQVGAMQNGIEVRRSNVTAIVN